MTSSPAPTEAGFKGMFSAKRSLKPQPKPARRGDKHATLFELALRTIIASTDEACPHDATLEECFEVSECIAEWPAACFEWVLPRINPKLLMACGATGLVHLGGEGKGAEADEMPPDGRRDAGWALREAARPLIEGAIRREELRYRQSRDTAMRAAADGPPLDVFSLVDIFGEWGRFVGKSEPPSLPMRQLLFADERAARECHTTARPPRTRVVPLRGSGGWGSVGAAAAAGGANPIQRVCVRACVSVCIYHPPAPHACRPPAAGQPRVGAEHRRLPRQLRRLHRRHPRRPRLERHRSGRGRRPRLRSPLAGASRVDQLRRR